MTTSQKSVTRLVGPLLEWLDNGGDAWEMDLAYWRRRKELMDAGELLLMGPEMTLLSSLDTALDVFSPNGDRNDFQIDEGQLRAEIAEAVSALKRLGYLTDT